MKNSLLFITVLILLLTLCGCTKKPPVTLPAENSCLKINNSIIGDEQTLKNPEFKAKFNGLLKAGLEEQGLHICGKRDRTIYRLVVTESRTLEANTENKFRHTFGPDPVTSIAIGSSVDAIKKGVASVYKSSISSDYDIDYMVRLANKMNYRVLISDSRPHYTAMDDEVKNKLEKHYINLAEDILKEVAKLHAEEEKKHPYSN